MQSTYAYSLCDTDRSLEDFSNYLGYLKFYSRLHKDSIVILKQIYGCETISATVATFLLHKTMLQDISFIKNFPQ